jgi:nickel-type superoxide dismutase maturation protease
VKPPISRFTVNGRSMLPTLTNGQDVLSFNWAYLGRKPSVGDIVVIEVDGKEMIKRVVEVNGKQVLVEGDNQKESTDSRDFGPIDMDQIVGKIVYGVNKQSFSSSEIPCPSCNSPVIGIYGRKDAICKNCGFKLACCGEP